MVRFDKLHFLIFHHLEQAILGSDEPNFPKITPNKLTITPVKLMLLRWLLALSFCGLFAILQRGALELNCSTVCMPLGVTWVNQYQVIPSVINLNELRLSNRVQHRPKHAYPMAKSWFLKQHEELHCQTECWDRIKAHHGSQQANTSQSGVARSTRLSIYQCRSTPQQSVVSRKRQKACNHAQKGRSCHDNF